MPALLYEICIAVEAGLRRAPMPKRMTTAAGSVAEFPLLARNPLKLPGGFRGRAPVRLMTDRGWKGDIALN
ncbi:hypothetical protein GCM10009076_11810 [Erythrobacter ramosus]